MLSSAKSESYINPKEMTVFGSLFVRYAFCTKNKEKYLASAVSTDVDK
jgi:hypothetical protein